MEENTIANHFGGEKKEVRHAENGSVQCSMDKRFGFHENNRVDHRDEIIPKNMNMRKKEKSLQALRCKDFLVWVRRFELPAS